MTICSADIQSPASVETQKLIRKLARLRVTHAEGCVVVSRGGFGEPPSGHDRVLSRVRAGSPPLGGEEHLNIQAAMADEMVSVVEQMMPPDCRLASVLVARYSLTPSTGVASLIIQTHGLVDHEATVVVS